MLICQIGFNSGVEMTVNFHMTFCALLPCLLFVFWVELSIVMTFMRTKMWNWNICIAAVVFPYFRPNIDVGGWSQGAKNNFCSPKRAKYHQSMKNEEWSLMLMSLQLLNFCCFTLWTIDATSSDLLIDEWLSKQAPQFWEFEQQVLLKCCLFYNIVVE